MKTYRSKGTITVFLSLLSAVFLSLLCTAIESARIEGCRAKAAAALDMGLFSVFGEFEKGLLDEYDVFGFDGSGGNGYFKPSLATEKLTDYMSYNVSPNKGILLPGYDPFGLRMQEAMVTQYQLLTDENGGAFYQQAVAFMKNNMGTEVISGLMERTEDAKKLEDAGKIYEERQKNNDEEMKALEKQQKQQEEERAKQEEADRKAAQERGEIVVQQETEAKPAVPDNRNPLKVIKKLYSKGLMALVLGEKKVSEKVMLTNIPSKRDCRRGSLAVEKKNSGMTADLLFMEYLFDRFSLYTDTEKGETLSYELEYILYGKNSDEKNLKSVVNKLMFLREGANYMYLMSDPAKKTETEALAMLLTGWIPVPGITAATEFALQLIWAYGESLLDVRELLDGGKVPVLKDAVSWRLELDKIPDLVEMLEGNTKTHAEGLTYGGYLQILYSIGNRKKYAMRALDLIEVDMKKHAGSENFRADNMITKIAGEAEFTIPPLFLKVPARFLKTGLHTQEYRITGSFAYY